MKYMKVNKRSVSTPLFHKINKEKRFSQSCFCQHVQSSLKYSVQNCRQKVFNRGALRLCGRVWHSKNWQKPYWFIVFHVQFEGLGVLFGGLSSPTRVATAPPPVATGLMVYNIRVSTLNMFWIQYLKMPFIDKMYIFSLVNYNHD